MSVYKSYASEEFRPPPVGGTGWVRAEFR